MNHDSHVLTTFKRTMVNRIPFDRTNVSHLRAYQSFCENSNWIDRQEGVEYKFIIDPIYPSLPVQVGKLIMKNAYEAVGIMDFKDEYELAAEKPLAHALNMTKPVLSNPVPAHMRAPVREATAFVPVIA